MLRTALATAFLAIAALPAAAGCMGTDLMTTLPATERDRIVAAIDALPYGRGNYWLAKKDGKEIHLVGTYHFDDPRHDAIFAGLVPAIDAAKTVLVEATPDEAAQLKAEMGKHPDRLFSLEGPTLPEELDPADWQELSKAMQDRGVPAFMASKMQPWYVSMLLGVPPCAMKDMQGEVNGLDTRIIARATEEGIRLRPLEPYDTVFTIFDSMGRDAQLDLIRTTLAIVDQAEDYTATLSAAYFAEDVRVSWEIGRLASQNLPGSTPEEIDADLDAMEEALMYRRNRSWIPGIEAAAEDGPIFVAFGALHLSGEEGVLNLLARRGWTISRLPFE